MSSGLDEVFDDCRVTGIGVCQIASSSMGDGLPELGALDVCMRSSVSYCATSGRCRPTNDRLLFVVCRSLCQCPWCQQTVMLFRLTSLFSLLQKSRISCPH